VIRRNRPTVIVTVRRTDHRPKQTNYTSSHHKR